MNDPTPKPPAPFISTPETRRKASVTAPTERRLWVLIVGTVLLLALPVTAATIFLFG